MMTNDESEDNNIITITTDERIEMNMHYLAWLYAKSKEEKKKIKQNAGLLLDTRHAIEVVMRDAGGEMALKELFLKEQDNRIINKLTKSNPKIEEIFKQDRDIGLRALCAFIAELEKNDFLNISQGAN